MPMQTAVRALGRVVSALDVAVGVLGVVRADNARPALAIRARQHQPVIRQPAPDVVVAVIG